jgi:hypothetical protein
MNKHDENMIEFFKFLTEGLKEKGNSQIENKKFFLTLEKFAEEGVPYAKRLVAEIFYNLFCSRTLGQLSMIIDTEHTDNMRNGLQEEFSLFCTKNQEKIIQYLEETEYLNVGETAYYLAELYEANLVSVSSDIVDELVDLSAAYDYPSGSFRLAVKLFK